MAFPWASHPEYRALRRKKGLVKLRKAVYHGFVVEADVNPDGFLEAYAVSPRERGAD